MKLSYLKSTLWVEAISILDLTKKTPEGGKVMTLLSFKLPTSITWRTSPTLVPKKLAFFMMKSCSFSVVQSIRQVPERESSVVIKSLPISARDSIASIIWDRILGFCWDLIPRSWSEMRLRRWVLGETDWDWDEEREKLGICWEFEGLKIELGFFEKGLWEEEGWELAGKWSNVAIDEAIRLRREKAE